MIARIYNSIVAVCVCLTGARIAFDWAHGIPADWAVWFFAIFGCVIVFLSTVRNAIRGVW